MVSISESSKQRVAVHRVLRSLRLIWLGYLGTRLGLAQRQLRFQLRARLL
ncbi:hypothetical protein HC891_19390 [Candidatus Gracilibacteria bacterium]|nr:hypothetical protein [Candidatus Gracilibacteria bacterium]